MADYVRVQGDLSHSIFATLEDKVGPVDLPVDTLVKFQSKISGATAIKTNAAATVIAPGVAVGHVDRGRVRYDPQPADLDTIGIYNVRWVVDFPSTVVPQSFPEGDPMVMLVMPTIANA